MFSAQVIVLEMPEDPPAAFEQCANANSKISPCLTKRIDSERADQNRAKLTLLYRHHCAQGRQRKALLLLRIAARRCCICSSSSPWSSSSSCPGILAIVFRCRRILSRVSHTVQSMHRCSARPSLRCFFRASTLLTLQLVAFRRCSSSKIASCYGISFLCCLRPTPSAVCRIPELPSSCFLTSMLPFWPNFYLATIRRATRIH